MEVDEAAVEAEEEVVDELLDMMQESPWMSERTKAGVAESPYVFTDEETVPENERVQRYSFPSTHAALQYYPRKHEVLPSGCGITNMVDNEMLVYNNDGSTERMFTFAKVPKSLGLQCHDSLVNLASTIPGDSMKKFGERRLIVTVIRPGKKENFQKLILSFYKENLDLSMISDEKLLEVLSQLYHVMILGVTRNINKKYVILSCLSAGLAETGVFVVYAATKNNGFEGIDSFRRKGLFETCLAVVRQWNVERVHKVFDFDKLYTYSKY